METNFIEGQGTETEASGWRALRALLVQVPPENRAALLRDMVKLQRAATEGREWIPGNPGHWSNRTVN